MSKIKQMQMAIFFAIFSVFLGFAGTNEELIKMHNGEIIGMVKLNKETMFADARGVGRTFYVSVPKSAKYFISIVASGITGQEYTVSIDDQRFVEGKVILSNGWQTSIIVDPASSVEAPKAISISKGEHSISFLGKGPEVPLIERIRVSENETDAQLSCSDLIAWQKALATKIIPADYADQKKSSTSNLSLAGTAVAGPSDPLYDYSGVLNTSFTYTQFVWIYPTPGQSYTFQTQNSTTDPVMYVFNQGNPQTYSYSDDDGGGGIESRISFVAPTNGWWAVVARSYSSSMTGTTNILLNGSVWVSNAALGGKMVYTNISRTGILNYYTAKPRENIDTKLFTMRSFTGLVNGYNDNWFGQGGDFNWGGLARIKQNYLQTASYCLIAHSSAGQSGTCDLYMGCGNSDIMPYFPNLKADDAIKSANSSGTYNCISWSGGVTIEWIWPPSDSRWNLGGGALASFDNYYKNYPVIRYSGAITYPTRVAPSTTGVEVDLWATGSYPSYSYTHGSVIKPANEQMHGYDWESKPGSLTRTFHPRNALNGTSYGAVVYSYKRASGASAMLVESATATDASVDFASTPKMKAMGINRPLSLDSSIILGLTVMRNVSFTDAEQVKSSALMANIPYVVKNEFSSKYAAWQKTWDDPKVAILSNPHDYANSAEYASLKDFCIKHGKVVWPLLFAKAQDELPFIQILMEDVMKISSLPEAQAVEAEFAGNQFTSDGAFINTTNKDRRLALVKKLLKTL